jgi:plastocyanin
MRRRRIVTILLAAAAVLPCAAAAGAGTSAPERKTVEVADNFFAPDRLTVHRGAKVTWKWPDAAGDVHDVKLLSGPKGVRRFQSQPASSGYRYRRTLRKAGTYRLICTFHAQEMKMTIKVRR